ncbi:hypothetical protein E4H12_11650 [Candidatus Thorarchaeota archaeon]|nr:MAG: hypothetical protein E4H12_11650 [Candidatus Thorarchaeota archaeon]
MVVKVLLVVNTEPGRQNEIYAVLKSFNEVSLLCNIERGQYDIVALVEVDTFDGYHELIKKVAALPNASDFASFITLDV